MKHGENQEVHKHEAYGLVTLVVSHGGHDTLFGSDLKHDHRVTIRVNRAEKQRSLSRDWNFAREQLIEFEMSHAQFAQFIMSSGDGGGTPVTLRYTAEPGSKGYHVSGIGHIETKHETFRREIVTASRKRLEAIQERIKALGELIDSGKTGKKELREIHSELARHADQLPGTMEFVVKSAEQALEKATHDAKIEVEAYIDTTARRLGLDSIAQLAQIEDKTGGKK